MNTAARMESNGKPGQVHLSGATADLLVKSGKQHWIVQREDKIVAKGKGEMQTYWVNIEKSPGSRASSMRSNSLDLTSSSEPRTTSAPLACTTSSAPDEPGQPNVDETNNTENLNPDRLMSYLGRGSVEVDA